jgi:hypothetical protein
MIKYFLVVLFVLISFLLNAQYIKVIEHPNGNSPGSQIMGVCGKMVDDNSFIVQAQTNDDKIVIAKFNLNGDSLWTYITEGTISTNGYFHLANRQLTITKDKGCVFTSNGNFGEFNFTKIDSLGNFQWSHKQTMNSDEFFVDRILETSDSGFIVLYTKTDNPFMVYMYYKDK